MSEPDLKRDLLDLLRIVGSRAERRGMERAAREVCMYCAAESPRYRDSEKFIWHANPHGPDTRCDSAIIWDALADEEDDA